jgi:hypothetical protein
MSRDTELAKDAKIWLIQQWTKGKKIVPENMLKLAIEWKNPPEVIDLLRSLQIDTIIKPIPVYANDSIKRYP